MGTGKPPAVSRATPRRSHGGSVFGQASEDLRRFRREVDQREQEREAAAAEYLRKVKHDVAARTIADDRSADRTTASPFDLLGDALFEVVADRVFEALNSPGFAEALRRRGFTVVPAVDPGDIPGPTAEWTGDGIDLYGATGMPSDLVERLDTMWRQAFQAGWDARGAADGETHGQA